LECGGKVAERAPKGAVFRYLFIGIPPYIISLFSLSHYLDLCECSLQYIHHQRGRYAQLKALSAAIRLEISCLSSSGLLSAIFIESSVTRVTLGSLKTIQSPEFVSDLNWKLPNSLANFAPFAFPCTSYFK
jgi:hypothetical protein